MEYIKCNRLHATMSVATCDSNFSTKKHSPCDGCIREMSREPAEVSLGDVTLSPINERYMTMKGAGINLMRYVQNYEPRPLTARDEYVLIKTHKLKDRILLEYKQGHRITEDVYNTIVDYLDSKSARN